MLVWLFALLILLSDLAGGWLAFRFQDRLHLALGLSAGLLIGLVFFDLFPEAIELGSEAGIEVHAILLASAAGFLAFYLLDHLFGLHPHQESDDHKHVGHVGTAGASGMTLHSLIDGIGIGAAFQTSRSLGIVVAVAVIGHRFSDGLNTVNILRSSGHSLRTIYRWLLVVGIAPPVGIALSYFIEIPTEPLAYALAGFGGIFLYVASADLLPEAHHAHPTRLTALMTVLGAVIIYIITQLAHGSV